MKKNRKFIISKAREKLSFEVYIFFTCKNNTFNRQPFSLTLLNNNNKKKHLMYLFCIIIIEIKNSTSFIYDLISL